MISRNLLSRRTPLVCFLLLFVCGNSFACLLKGNIKESKTSLKIPYVTIYLNDANGFTQQAMANANGYFEIDLRTANFPLNISFKSIGYDTKIIQLKECIELTVALQASVLNISQVEIKELSTKTIVANCLNGFNKNLYSEPFNYEVFYRKHQTDANGKFLYSTEYYSKVYQLLGDQPGIKNIKTRFNSVENKYYDKAIKEGNWEIRWMLAYELYASAQKKFKFGIINKKNINDLHFTFLGDLIYEEEEYYKISYAGDTSKNDYRKGILYIHKNNFCLLYFSSELFIDKKIKIKKEFFYTKLNNHYFLSHIKEWSRNYDLTNNEKIMFVHNYEFKNIQKLENNTKSIINTSFKKEQNFEPDSAFWNGLNYIPKVR